MLIPRGLLHISYVRDGRAWPGWRADAEGMARIAGQRAEKYDPIATGVWWPAWASLG